MDFRIEFLDARKRDQNDSMRAQRAAEKSGTPASSNIGTRSITKSGYFHRNAEGVIK